MTIEELILDIVQIVKPIIENNWSFFLGMVFALIASKALKSGMEIAATILVVAIGISVLTNLGILPPLNELLDLAGRLVDWIIQSFGYGESVSAPNML